MLAQGASEPSASKILRLPGEIRNKIYQDTYEDLDEDVVADWALNSSKVSRNWYNEAMPTIVSGLHHSIYIRFDNVWNETNFQITNGKAPRGMVRYIKHLEVTISIEHEGHPDLAAQILELETNLRKVAITLVHGEARLESLTIKIEEGGEVDRRQALNPTHVFELLDSLREIRVTKDVQITGLVNDHSEYLQSIKNSMLLPEASDPSYAESQVIKDKKIILGICLDIQTYVRTCRRIVDNWDNENPNKKVASLRNLAQIFPESENWEQQHQSDPVKILPDNINNTKVYDEIIPKALDQIEQFNKSITNPRLRRYSKNAPFDQMTDAYDRLYMRRSFLEIKLGRQQQKQQQQQQLSVDDPLFYFLADSRYENWPWNVLTYEEYNN